MKQVKLSTLQKKADDLQSRYIRQKYADAQGYVKCVSCGVVKHWKEMDCGHFVPKSRGAAVRYVEENTAPECQACNRFDEGHLIGYTRFMLDMYGPEKIEELQRLAKKGGARSRLLALEAIDYYGPKLAELTKEEV